MNALSPLLSVTVFVNFPAVSVIFSVQRYISAKLVSTIQLIVAVVAVVDTTDGVTLKVNGVSQVNIFNPKSCCTLLSHIHRRTVFIKVFDTVVSCNDPIHSETPVSPLAVIVGLTSPAVLYS